MPIFSEIQSRVTSPRFVELSNISIFGVKLPEEESHVPYNMRLHKRNKTYQDYSFADFDQ